MLLLKAIISALVLPPALLVLGAAAGLLVIRRHPRLGHAVVATCLLALLLLSMPWLANSLQRSLEIYAPPQPQGIASAQAIVVLGAGTYRAAPEYGGIDTVDRNGLLRVRYAAHLQRQTGLPLMATGGAPLGGRSEAETMREMLEGEFQVPVRWQEPNSDNTFENARNSSEILKRERVGTIVLVTDAIHMARAKLQFERNGIAVIAAPTGFVTDAQGIYRFLPSAGALERSSYALREWLGLSLARLMS